MPTLEDLRLQSSGAMRDAYQRRRAEEEANAKAHTFDLGKMIIPTITSIATQNPTPFLLAAAGEGARASTGSDTDLATAAQGLQSFMPTKPITPAPIGPAMQSGDFVANKPSPISDYFGKMGSNFGYAPQTRNEQAAADIISKGGLKPKSVVYQGVDYSKPTIDWESEKVKEIKRHNLVEEGKPKFKPDKPGKPDKPKPYNVTQAEKRAGALMQDPDAQALMDKTIFIDNATGFTYKKIGNEFISMGY